MKFPKLFEPLKLGNVILPNRIVMLHMTTNFSQDGSINERLVSYYAKWIPQTLPGLTILSDRTFRCTVYR